MVTTLQYWLCFMPSLLVGATRYVLCRTNNHIRYPDTNYDRLIRE